MPDIHNGVSYTFNPNFWAIRRRRLVTVAGVPQGIAGQLLVTRRHRHHLIRIESLGAVENAQDVRAQTGKKAH